MHSQGAEIVQKHLLSLLKRTVGVEVEGGRDVEIGKAYEVYSEHNIVLRVYYALKYVALPVGDPLGILRAPDH